MKFAVVVISCGLDGGKDYPMTSDSVSELVLAYGRGCGKDYPMPTDSVSALAYASDGGKDYPTPMGTALAHHKRDRGRWDGWENW